MEPEQEENDENTVLNWELKDETLEDEGSGD